MHINQTKLFKNNNKKLLNQSSSVALKKPDTTFYQLKFYLLTFLTKQMLDNENTIALNVYQHNPSGTTNCRLCTVPGNKNNNRVVD